MHAFCAMSTHLHVVLTDTRGELPRFLEQFHRLVGLCTKVLRKWEGCTWDHEQTSVVRLETPEVILDKIGYVLANPVASGLVRYARDWPGAKSRLDELGGGHVRAKRPVVYLDATNERWPDEAVLDLALPSYLDAGDATAWVDAVKQSVAEHEARGREVMDENGRKFLGAERAESVSPYDRATSSEPLRGRNPTFASGAAAGAFAGAVAALREFRAAYAAAMERWRAGSRGAVFPAGTWSMARVHSVVVAT